MNGAGARLDSVTARSCTISISDDHSSIVAILLCNPVSTTAFCSHEKDAAIREQLRSQFGVARYQAAVRWLRPMAARIVRDSPSATQHHENGSNRHLGSSRIEST